VSEGARPSDERHQEELSEEELAEHDIAQLPDREAMSIIGDIAIPLDPDMAADALLGHDAPDGGDAGD
jgi:hypothetical protein